MAKNKIGAKKHKASILGATLIILGAMLAITLSASVVSVQERKASIGANKSSLAYQEAESGIENVMQRIKANRVDPSATVAAIDMDGDCDDGIISLPGKYKVELKPTDINAVIDCNTPLSTIEKIKSVGFSGQNSRAIEVELAGSCSSGDTTSGLIGYWPFDEVNGSETPDSGSGGNDGTIGGATPTSGKAGNALYFGGDGDYVDMGDPASGAFDFGTGDFSVSLWAKTSQLSVSGIWPTLVRKVAAGVGYELMFGDPSYPYTYFKTMNGASTTGAASSSTTLNDDQWHHYVAVRTSSGSEFFVDSDSQGEHLSFPLDISNAASLRVGSPDEWDWADFEGSIDEVRIYDRALNKCDVQELYAGATTPPIPPTDTTPPTVYDFMIPAASSSLTVAITTLTATDDVGVTGYMLTESDTQPSAGAAGWYLPATPASYAFSSAGSKTLYAWAKDAAGNVSASLSGTVVITLDTTPPTITNVSSDKANGTYGVGEVIDIDVTFSEAVTSTGNVTVTLETGTTDRTCTFLVSNSTTGTCNYTVQSGDTSGDLNVNSISGTIRDQALNSMTNFTPAANLASNKNIVINTAAATLIGHWKLDDGLGTERIPNGNFNTDTSGWQTNGASSLTWQNAVSGNGSTGYMRFNINSNSDYDRFATNNGVNITSPNTAYQISFWYRTSGITGNLQAYSGSSISTLGTTASWASSQITPSTSWRFYSTTLTTDAADYPMFGISKLGAIGSGTFDIDAISVKTTSSSTTTAADSSGYSPAADGTLANGPVWTSGPVNGGLNFDGANDRVSLGNPAKLNLNTNFTISAWVKADSFANSNAGIIAKGLGATVAIRADGNSGNCPSTKCFTFRINDGTNNRESSVDASPENTWHHLVMVVGARGAGGLKGYVDGVERVVVDTSGAGAVTSSDNLYFGYNERNNAYLDGTIDDARIYNSALSASEIQDLYNLGTP